jgi:transposase
MWQLKKGSAFLPYVSLQRLQKLYEREDNAKAKLRLLAAIRRKKGGSIDDIAAHLEKPRRTIHGWLQRFEQRRLKAVHDKKQPGRTPKLTRSQLRRLRRELIRGPAHVPGRLWTVRLVNEHLRKNYSIDYERKHLTTVLHNLGFSVQKPRQQHYKADLEAQARFKKKLDESARSIAIMDGRSRVWTNARSISRPTSQEVGR